MRRLKAILHTLDGPDLLVMVFILGLALVAYGSSQIMDGLGVVVLGVLLLAYVGPLRNWIP